MNINCMILSDLYTVVTELLCVIGAMRILSQPTLPKGIHIHVAGGYVVVVMDIGLLLFILVLNMKTYTIYTV